MSTEKIFKQTILLNLFIFMAGGAYSIYIMPYDLEVETELTAYEVVGLVLLVAYFYTIYLLYYFKPLGKTLFLPFTILSYLTSLYDPYDYFKNTDEILYFLYSLSSLSTGVILTLLYLTELKTKFDRQWTGLMFNTKKWIKGKEPQTEIILSYLAM